MCSQCTPAGAARIYCLCVKLCVELCCELPRAVCWPWHWLCTPPLQDSNTVGIHGQAFSFMPTHVGVHMHVSWSGPWIAPVILDTRRLLEPGTSHQSFLGLFVCGERVRLGAPAGMDMEYALAIAFRGCMYSYKQPMSTISRDTHRL